MTKKRTHTLADQVKASERRDAPKAQARATRSGTWSSLSLGLVVLAIVLTAGTLAYLLLKRII